MAEGKADFSLHPLRAQYPPIPSRPPGLDKIPLEIMKLYSAQLGKPDNSIVKGEDFSLVMEVEFSPLLGDLEAKYEAKFHALNLDTGNKANAYSGTIIGNLVAGTNKVTMQFDIKNAQEEGVFLLAGSFGLPHSLLNDFSLGGTVKSGETRKVANFFVFEK
jgi:hypothetical protein